MGTKKLVDAIIKIVIGVISPVLVSIIGLYINKNLFPDTLNFICNILNFIYKVLIYDITVSVWIVLLLIISGILIIGVCKYFLKKKASLWLKYTEDIFDNTWKYIWDYDKLGFIINDRLVCKECNCELVPKQKSVSFVASESFWYCPICCIYYPILSIDKVEEIRVKIAYKYNNLRNKKEIK